MNLLPATDLGPPDREFRGWGRALAMMSLAGVCLAGVLLAGCNARPVGGPPQSDGSPVMRVVNAEWDDLESAVRSVGFTTSAALVSTERVSDFEAIFIFATAGDTALRLVATRATAMNAVAISLMARADPFGDVELETQVLGAVASRLAALNGARYAPLKGYQ